MNKQNLIIIPIVFTWIGFVCAISFMEAWLKFQAPGITIPLGLGIGRLVFQALNKVEWVCLFSITSIYLISPKTKWSSSIILLLIAILLTQTFYLLPFLGQRATAIIAGHIEAPSTLHIVYIISEVVKVVCLFLLGINILRKTTVLD